MQAFHRIRDQLGGSRTRLISQMRGSCLKYDVAIRQGTAVFKHDLPRVIADKANDLTSTMRRVLEELHVGLGHLEAHIKQLTKEIKALTDKDDVARRLLTIPGIGALEATALHASIGDGRQFRKARDVGAWLGFAP